MICVTWMQSMKLWRKNSQYSARPSRFRIYEVRAAVDDRNLLLYGPHPDVPGSPSEGFFKQSTEAAVYWRPDHNCSLHKSCFTGVTSHKTSLSHNLPIDQKDVTQSNTVKGDPVDIKGATSLWQNYFIFKNKREKDQKNKFKKARMRRKKTGQKNMIESLKSSEFS